jgi:O-antigen/teichoic acid export membrane protein
MPRRSLGQASLLLLGSTWIHSGLGLVASVLIGRILGPAAVGALALNLGLAGLVMAAALPGFSRAHLKRLAEGEDTGRCLGTMGLIQGGLAAILGLALLVAGGRAPWPARPPAPRSSSSCWDPRSPCGCPTCSCRCSSCASGW